jgi:hypothetical protein
LRHRSTRHGLSLVATFLIAAILVIVIGGSLTLLYPSIAPVVSKLPGATTSQSYPSYSPPRYDTISLKDPCRWWCNANAYDSYILNYSALFGVPDPMLIKSQIALESAFNPNVTSTIRNGACGGVDYGLMQINPSCNNVDRSKLFDPQYNLYWGIKFWANDYLHMKQKWGSSCSTSQLLTGTLELYNGGASFVGSKCGSFPMGQNYTSLVGKYYYPFAQNAGYTVQMQPPSQ